MQMPSLLDDERLHANLRQAIPPAIEGTIWSVGSHAMAAVDLPVPMGAHCEIQRPDGSNMLARVIGFEGARTLLTTLECPTGVCPGNRVRFRSAGFSIRVGNDLLGRVVDSMGVPIDDAPLVSLSNRVPLNADPPPAIHRGPIDAILETGVRAIDAMLTIGRGQRLGIFAGSGVGKSSLLGMLARNTHADVIVVGLIGERGREVREFLTHEIDASTRQKCVTVVATSDQPALQRIHAAQTSTAIAEYFRDQGKHVLLLVDSITRCALAQREVGLASGEPPTTRGYPASVFSMLPKLVERSGPAREREGSETIGSITGMYTVLVEGDDPHEPVSDALRGLLDGHIQLSRKLAEAGCFPAIDILNSLSRLQRQLVDDHHLELAARVRQLLADYRDHEELISIGAYKHGTQPRVDRAIASRNGLQRFFCQDCHEQSSWEETLTQLASLTEF